MAQPPAFALTLAEHQKIQSMVESTNSPQIEELAQVVPKTPEVSRDTREELALNTVLTQGVCNSSASAGLQHHHDTSLRRMSRRSAEVCNEEGARGSDDSMQAFLDTVSNRLVRTSNEMPLTRIARASHHGLVVPFHIGPYPMPHRLEALASSNPGPQIQRASPQPLPGACEYQGISRVQGRCGLKVVLGGEENVESSACREA